MGFVVDTSVLVDAERRGHGLPLLADESVIAAITASELLHGLHRAASNTERTRREAFITAVLEDLPIVAFDLHIARIHARLWAECDAVGTPVGSHDLMIAATAQALGWAVWTLNEKDFTRIPGTDLFDGVPQ